MKALLRTGKRIVTALRGRSPASECSLCEPLRRENDALRQQVETLRKQNQAQQEENTRLRESLSEAHRAGKRQAAPFSKGPPKTNPKRPGRKPGKDYGVKARRAIPDHFDESYEAPIGPRCTHCGGQELEDTEVVEQYEEDIPPVRPRIRRFRIHLGRCLRCGRRVQGRHPLQTSDAIGAACVHLGPHAKALAADLNKHIGTSFGKVRSIFRVSFGLSITRGGLSQALDRVAGALAPTYDALVEQVHNAPVVAADETGWKVGGCLQWLWVFVTPTVTVCRIMDGRGFEEACAVLGADFDGTLLRDGWAPYRRFEQATHQTCVGGHLIRRCKENLETAQRGTARLPHAILRILQRALRLRDRWVEHPPTPHGRATHVGIIAADMDRFLAWRPSDDENRKLVKHLLNERGALLTFLRDPTVPASNWWGEQAIRPAVVTRKIWGGNRTTEGALTQQILLTAFRTCDQQSVDPYAVIAELLRSSLPRLASLPSLASGP
ncbi:MAG: IS66 family transposase [Thermodesulfobacteriota bacterium]